jgi:hypothetical protein
MQSFMREYGKMVLGSISGWDRIRFRGTIRWLANARGLSRYLAMSGILLKDFGDWAEEKTRRVRGLCEAEAKRQAVPVIYLNSSSVDKDALARKVAKERGVQTGTICWISVVEPCIAPLIRGNRAEKTLELNYGLRKCVWMYQYWNDPELGFGHTRLQSWLPLSVTACINGRHWLERQLIGEGIGYLKDGNCFPYIEDLGKAHDLLQQQQRTNWPTLLDALLERNCPGIRHVLGPHPMDYYWSAEETEWATDIYFRSDCDLERIYPRLLRYGILSAQSPEVMRFLGRKTMAGALPGEVRSDLSNRYEGARLRHWVNRNSVKMYNKSSNLLRVETTINQTRDFKVFRCPNDDPHAKPSWQKMRKGVGDFHRRGQVSQACNERYLDGLAAVSLQETLQETAAGICKPVKRKTHRYRAFNPWRPEDFALLQFLAEGRNAINGFRNRDLREHLFPSLLQAEPQDQRRGAGKVTRRIQLLRAHGLVKKVPRSHRYLLTAKGRKVVAAILAASSAHTQQLMDLAA